MRQVVAICALSERNLRVFYSTLKTLNFQINQNLRVLDVAHVKHVCVKALMLYEDELLCLIPLTIATLIYNS